MEKRTEGRAVKGEGRKQAEVLEMDLWKDNHVGYCHDKEGVGGFIASIVGN